MDISRIDKGLRDGTFSLGELALALLNESKPQESAVLGTRRSIADVPDTAEDLYNHSAPHDIARCRRQIEAIQAWTPEQATAEAAERNRHRRKNQQWHRLRREQWAPRIEAIERCIRQLTAWQPAAEDHWILDDLWRIRDLMLAGLYQFLAYRRPMAADNGPDLTGPQLQAEEIARLKAEIADSEAFMAQTKAKVDKIHPLALALRDNLARLDATPRS
jgi:hypothetical protein